MTRPASNGSIIGATQDPTPTSAGGIWTLPAQLELQKQGKWIAPGYNISRSLRFDSARSTYLSRTPASAGNRKTFTWSGWVKRSSSGSQAIMGVGTNTSDDVNFTFNNDKLYFLSRVSSSIVLLLDTTQVFRDFSSWYHIVVAIDTTQATSSNRVKFYVNGTQITAFGTATYPSQNQDLPFNNNVAHEIGRVNNQFGPSQYFNGYMTEIHFIDGQALDPSYFGVVDNLTGVWRPKQVEDMNYGTNGFYLPFSDNTSTTTLGYDQSGNANNWTLSAGFSVAAGANNDSLVDTPTQYGTDTGAGGEVRGNYATLNYLMQESSYSAVSNGNLRLYTPTNGISSSCSGTIAITSGKFYWEVLVEAVGGNNVWIGISQTLSYRTRDAYGDILGYNKNGERINNNPTGSAYGATYTTNDVIGVAYDADAGTLAFYKNGSSQGTAFSGLSLTGGVYPRAGGDYQCALVFNFGQRPFAYTAPSGFKALCTTNLPDPTVVQGDDYFNTVLYTGNGSTQSITGVGFQPDFVWAKDRIQSANHRLFDAVRGASKILYSSLTNSETTDANGLTSFNSNGFSVGSSQINDNNYNYVAWNWKANGAGSSNTDGTITSTVSANTTAGISIVTYTGTGSAATVGHGLGVAPSMVIIKDRSESVQSWTVFHIALGATKYIDLNSTGASGTDSNRYPSVPSSTVVSIGTSQALNKSPNNYVAYCFAAIPGFSAFGSYTGNGSTDGPFVYTGFRPAFVVIKLSSASGDGWLMQDTVRFPYNAASSILVANSSGAESTFVAGSYPNDYLSNGFKIRNTGTGYNSSGATYIYMAFAENPFKYSLAR